MQNIAQKTNQQRNGYNIVVIKKNFYFTAIHITLRLAIIEAPGKALAVIGWFNGLNTSNCGMHGPTFGNAPSTKALKRARRIPNPDVGL